MGEMYIIVLALYASYIKRFSKNIYIFLPLFTLIGYGYSQVINNYGIFIGSTLFETYTIVITTLMSFTLMNETITLKKLIALILSISSIIVIR